MSSLESTTADPTAPPSLREFIRGRRDEIFGWWKESIRQLPVASGLTERRLVDHLPHILDAIAEMLETDQPSSLLEQMPETHALERLDEGFDLGLVTREYSLLRETIVRLYETEYPGARLAADEVRRLNSAIDDAVQASVIRFARARERTLVAVDRMAAAALEASNLGAFLPRLLRVLVETTRSVDTVTVMLRDGDRLFTRASVGLEAEVAAQFSLRIGEGFSGRIAETLEPLELRDAAHSEEVASPEIRAQQLRALYGVPLMRGDELIGVAHMGSRTAWDFSAEDKLLFRTMAHRAAALIVQAQLADSERRARTAAERAQDALHQRDLDLATVADNISQLAWMADPDGRIYWFNRRWYEFTGTTLEQVSGFGWMSVLAPDHAERLMEKLRHHFHEGTEWEDTFPLRGRDGGYRWFLTRAVPIRDDSGQVRRWFGTNTDITEQRAAAEELRRTAEFRERFIGVVSHDLRNPLQAITMSASVMAQSPDVPAKLARPVGRILASSAKMKRLIEDLLDFTRGRLGGGIPIHPEPTNLRHLARHAVEELELNFPERTITLHADGDVVGSWDPARLGQMLTNLASNALTYSPPGTPVDVRITPRGDEVEISVHNRGAPIRPALIPTMFEPFQRGQTGEGSGLGLGLFIVSEIARAHRGMVAVSSSEAEGTTFTVTLPRVTSTSAPAPSPASAPGH